MGRIDSFREEYAFLSNFHPVDVIIDGLRYSTTEAAFQALKTDNFTERCYIASLSPGAAKRFGHHVHLRPNWETVKVDAMRRVLREKFSAKHPGLVEKLLATGDAELVEGNTWHDNFWGACTCERCSGREKKNTLGHLLMERRAELKKDLP